jgi:mono/diheme cytochrome c family protein
MRYAILLAALLSVLLIACAKGGPATEDTLPSNVVPSGEVMYKQYCAVCHGLEAKGDGPYAPMLKVPPPDLTTLSKRHGYGGKFPYDYVFDILSFGPRITIFHGSSDMPAWGSVFQYLYKNDEPVVQKRIKNLCDYLASLQMTQPSSKTSPSPTATASAPL